MKLLVKIKDLMLKHKLLAIIVILTFILILVMFIMLFSMLVTSSNKYGSRLEGIKDVEISKSTFKELNKKIKDNDSVSDVNIHLTGKIVYFDIKFKNGTKKDDAKKIASATLEEFSKEELAFYDFEYILMEAKKDDKDTSNYVITGTKHNKLDKITWSKS